MVSCSVGLNELNALELDADEAMGELPLLRDLPLRCALVALHTLVDDRFHGHRFDSAHSLDPRKGIALAGRLAYLVPLLSTADPKFAGADAFDCVEAVFGSGEYADDVQRMVLYAHFCELMPEVHRGYYEVAGDRASGFRLTHPSSAFARHEALDILFTELSKPVGLRAPAQHAAFDQIMPPTRITQQHIALIQQFADYYRQALFEPRLIGDAGFEAAAGVPREVFARCRAAIWGHCDYVNGISHALTRLIDDPNNDPLGRELWEWMSVNLNANFYIALIAEVAGVSLDEAEAVINLFTLDFRPESRRVDHAGDGFFPPFARVNGSLVFNPDLVRLFILERNIAYALNARDPDEFGALVADELEPELIVQFEGLLAPSGFEVKPNVHWTSEGAEGEIDVLLYSAADNTALHVQAKAAIPPQGARMVSRITDRTREGLKQIEAFRALSPGEVDRIVAQSLGRPVNDVAIRHALLSRSGFGTAEVWTEAAGDVVFLNLPVVALARERLADATVTELIAQSGDVAAEIERQCRPVWTHDQLMVEGVAVGIPILEYDEAAHARLQAQTLRVLYGHTR
jgi:hypothetical protein